MDDILSAYTCFFQTYVGLVKLQMILSLDHKNESLWSHSAVFT